MRTGFLIIARLGSTRLPNKHLIEVSGKTFIEWLAARFVEKFGALIEVDEAKIIVATSDREENRKFSELFYGSDISVFYGADENIPLRQLECAHHFQLDNIISIDGDDILCSSEAAAAVLDRLSNGTDAIKTTGLPLGMNIMGYKLSYLENCIADHKDAKLETGWGRIFESTMIELPVDTLPADERLRFTLDYEQDAAFFTNIIHHFSKGIINASDTDIVNYVLQNHVYNINASLNEIYWQNFNLTKQAEL